MSLREAVERWRTASEAGDIEAMDEAARATLRTHDDRSRTVARTAVMAAMGEAANAGDEAALRVALAKIEPADLEAFREAVPTRPLPVARAVSNINDPRPAAILSAAGDTSRVLAIAKANMGPARIQCVARLVRATSSGWILGFKAGDTWHDRKGDDTPAGGSAGKVPNV